MHGVFHSASRRAATKPSPPLLPGPARISTGSVSRPLNGHERPGRRRDRGPGVLHEALAGGAQLLRLGSAPVIASAVIGGRGRRRPSELELVEA